MLLYQGKLKMKKNQKRKNICVIMADFNTIYSGLVSGLLNSLSRLTYNTKIAQNTTYILTRKQPMVLKMFLDF